MSRAPFAISIASHELEGRFGYDPWEEDAEQNDADDASLQAWLAEVQSRPDWRLWLDRIPPYEADLVELTIEAGKKQAELAHIFGVTQAAISYRLDRARERLQFLASLPDIEVDLELLPEVLDGVSIEIVLAMWHSTSQTEVSNRLGYTQGRVRHRFLSAVERLKKAAETDPKFANLHKAFSLVVGRWNILSEVQLDQWQNRKGDILVDLDPPDRWIAI